MKRLITLLVTMSLLGCNATESPEIKASADLSQNIVMPPVCAFDGLILNGSDALDPARSNYSCKYSGQAVPNRVIHVFFSNGAGRLQDPSIGPVENTTWTLDSSTCHITVKVSAITRYILSAPVLNSDSTLNGAGAYNQPANTNRLLIECVHDMSPGQAF